MSIGFNAKCGNCGEQYGEHYYDDCPNHKTKFVLALEDKGLAATDSVAGGPWVEWKGGDCLVPGNARVNYRLRNGLGTAHHPASSLRWKHTGGSSDIVAYRVLAPEYKGLAAPKNVAEPLEEISARINAAVLDSVLATPTPPTEGGTKYDSGKPRMDLLDTYAIEQLAKVLTFGAEKYAAHNWRQGLPKSRLIAAGLRHIFAYLRGEDTDPESGLSHIAHAMCCCMFLLGLEHRVELDDRWKA